MSELIEIGLKKLDEIQVIEIKERERKNNQFACRSEERFENFLTDECEIPGKNIKMTIKERHFSSAVLDFPDEDFEIYADYNYCSCDGIAFRAKATIPGIKYNSGDIVPIVNATDFYLFLLSLKKRKEQLEKEKEDKVNDGE